MRDDGLEVDGGANKALATLHRLARIDADPDPDRALGLVVPEALRGRHDRQAAGHRATGGWKDDVEGVALGADLRPSVAGDLLAHEGAISVEQIGRSGVTVALDEGGVAAQVSEQEAAVCSLGLFRIGLDVGWLVRDPIVHATIVSGLATVSRRTALSSTPPHRSSTLSTRSFVDARQVHSPGCLLQWRPSAYAIVKIELDKFHTPPAVRAEPEDAPVNALGIRRIMFAVDDIDAVLARLRAHGAELVGEVVQYEDSYQLCYVRGPEGIMVALAEPLG